MTHPAARSDSVTVARWPTEGLFTFLVVLLSIVAWVVLVVSIVGIAYAAFIALFFFIAHLIFIAHVRGSAVKIGPDQFPELHEAVERLARKLGLRNVPDAYVMQASGALNALATKFLSARMIILFSDLLEACGDDTAARDMIVAHELGHIKAGHLTMQWLLLPGLMFPFLGQALSRAREYTCDRYGLVGAGDLEGALLGLSILAAGPKLGRRVNRTALAWQRIDMNTGWMTIGEWLSTHPPLAKRVTALDPTLRPDVGSNKGAILASLTVTGLAGGIVALIAVFVLALIPALEEMAQVATEGSEPAAIDTAAAMDRARSDMASLSAVIEAHRQATGELPADFDELYDLWVEAHPGAPEPYDPFDGYPYGYEIDENGYWLFSSGPDGMPGTEDDLIHDSRTDL